MDLTPFKHDIDELIDAFAEVELGLFLFSCYHLLCGLSANGYMEVIFGFWSLMFLGTCGFWVLTG